MKKLFPISQNLFKLTMTSWNIVKEKKIYFINKLLDLSNYFRVIWPSMSRIILKKKEVFQD